MLQAAQVSISQKLAFSHVHSRWRQCGGNDPSILIPGALSLQGKSPAVRLWKDLPGKSRGPSLWAVRCKLAREGRTVRWSTALTRPGTPAWATHQLLRWPAQVPVRSRGRNPPLCPSCSEGSVSGIVGGKPCGLTAGGGWRVADCAAAGSSLAHSPSPLRHASGAAWTSWQASGLEARPDRRVPGWVGGGRSEGGVGGCGGVKTGGCRGAERSGNY